MFIRQTRTHNKITGEGYFTFRLVRGERLGGKVRPITVLNLGRHFSVKQEDRPFPCLCLEKLLYPQDNFLPMAYSERLCSREVLISPQRLDFMTNPNQPEGHGKSRSQLWSMP